jgi:SAM-dependent methyltransferase
MESSLLKQTVRDYYAQRALTGTSCGCGCGCGTGDTANVSRAIGYSEADAEAIPEGADLGLGCGNPTALTAIPAGATVLDLGSGAGIDCFLAVQQVGAEGHVIGVDMTPEMIARARDNAAKGGYANVEFRLGEIESLPVRDETVDVVLSNCVINLSPEKPRVFAEAFRVLRPGGRLAVSDIVLTRPLPQELREDLEAYAGCIGGAELADVYLDMIRAAGFTDIRVAGADDYLAALAEAVQSPLPVETEGLPVRSLKVTAVKPVRAD